MSMTRIEQNTLLAVQPKVQMQVEKIVGTCKRHVINVRAFVMTIENRLCASDIQQQPLVNCHGSIPLYCLNGSPP
jgi:hypothetical protein